MTTTILTPITSEGQSANLRIEREEIIRFGKPRVDITIYYTLPDGSTSDIRIYQRSINGEMLQADIQWSTFMVSTVATTRAFHTALTEAIAQATAENELTIYRSDKEALAALTPPPAAAAPQPAIAWDAPAPADAAEWLDKPFTPAAPAPTVKLTTAQRTALELLNKQTVMWDEIVGEWRICRGNMITSQKVNARVVKSLIAHGLLSKVDDDEYAVSAAGRAALGGER